MLHKVSEFAEKMPTNAQEFIDNQTQKVMINSGVPYRSTSYNEVFERRFRTNEAEILRRKNRFISAPKDTSLFSRYQSKVDDTSLAC